MKKYDYSISYIRMIAMMMVIACHVLQQISPAMGSFSGISKQLGDYCANGVQIFLLVSGYLYAQKKEYFLEAKSRIEFVIRSLKKILIEYWCYCFLVIFPVYVLLEPESIGMSTALGILTTAKTMWGVHHLWFISYILVCYLITPALFDLKTYLVNNSKNRLILGLGILLFLIEWLSYWFESYFVAEWICAYCIGFFIPEFVKMIKYGGGRICFAICFSLCIILNVFRYYASYVEPELVRGILGEHLTLMLCNWSQVFFAITFFWLVIGKIKPGKTLRRILCFSDKYSYCIYLVHMIYVKGVLCTVFLTESKIVNIIITLIVIFISGITFYYVCRPRIVLEYIKRRMYNESSY